MPLYEYQCEACGGRFERIQKFSDPPVETCAVCGDGPVQKLLSSPAIQFKGSGWYVTDYARKSSESKASANGSSSPAKTETGGEAKPAESKSGTGEAAPASKPETKAD